MWNNASPVLKGVIEVDGSDPEDELVDKSGATIGTKFSVLHCIRIPFLMRCGFLTVESIHKNIRFHRKAFPSDNTAGVFSRTFIIVKNIYPTP